jgi:uncharacterized protein YbjQ (UPF0145 family)
MARYVLCSGCGQLAGPTIIRSNTMSDLKGKAKQNMHEAADAAKKAADNVVDRSKELGDQAAVTFVIKSKDVAHKAGKKMETAGKHLQNA